MFEQIKKEILKCTKKRKFKRTNFEDLFSFNYGINAYMMKGRVLKYTTNKNKKSVRVIKPFKLGASKYKLEIVLASNFAICIDAKKVNIYDEPESSTMMDYNTNKPVFSSENISKVDFFNLSTKYEYIFTEEEINTLREIMEKRAVNRCVSVYATPVVVGGLVPWKW